MHKGDGHLKEGAKNEKKRKEMIWEEDLEEANIKYPVGELWEWVKESEFQIITIVVNAVVVNAKVI